MTANEKRERQLKRILWYLDWLDYFAQYNFLYQSRQFMIGLVLTGSILFTVFAVYTYQLLFTANFQVGKKDTVLFIPTGATFKTVMDSLDKNKIVHDMVSFAFLSKLMNYQKFVKPGKYIIKKDMGNYALIQALRTGKQATMKLTFNNIRLKKEFVSRVSEELEMDAQELDSLLNSQEYLAAFDCDTTTVMCMFIPNTYEFFWNISPDNFIKRMHKEYLQFWHKERTEKAKALQLTPHQVIILASIVQAETAKEDEKRTVAGVYLNRLKKKMKLQADPTVVFAVGDFGIKRLLNKHLDFDSPYNTYKYKGLPPGPINLPSVNSIDAVLNSEKHKYLFFCAKEDFSGYHNFAVTNAEHEENARRYQKALNERKIYQ